VTVPIATGSTKGRLEQLSLALERLWLRALPRLTREYRWAEFDECRIYGSTYHQLFLYRLLRGRIEPYTIELFRRALRPGMVVLDVGAYIGYFTVLAARTVGGTGKVYAFECDERNIRFLSHNIVLNRCRNIELVNKAAADRAGVLPFFVRRGDPSQSSLWHESGKGHREDVECTTIDAVTGGDPVNVVKMDIEGGEIQALRGMDETAKRSAKLTMFVECHPDALSSAQGSAEMLVEELERMHFRVEVIDESGRALRSIDEELSRPRRAEGKKYFYNLLCTKGS
jgi:FkbM family methyltransferase